MFNHLFDFKLKRSFLQAVGFYFFYLFLLLFTTTILGGFIGIISKIGFFGMSSQSGFYIGNAVAILFCIILSFVILNKKIAYTPINVSIALLAGFLSIFGGGILGLLPILYLTMIENKNQDTENLNSFIEKKTQTNISKMNLEEFNLPHNESSNKLLLKRSESAIKHAFICGIIVAFITLCMAVVGIAKNGYHLFDAEYNAYSLIDFGILLGLTIGVYSKLRSCAIGLFLFYLLGQIILWTNLDFNVPLIYRLTMVTSGLIPLLVFARGVWGSIIYNKIKTN